MAANETVILDDREFQKWVQKVLKRLENPTDVKKFVGMVGTFVFKDVMKHFDDEKGPTSKWDDWSESYKTYLRSIGRISNRKLQFSGRMKNSFTPEKYRKNQHSLTWYNNAKTKGGYPYAWGHNYGDGQLPQREFMWLSNDALEKIITTAWDEFIKDSE
jgi:phage gpG-like protein